MIVKRAYWLSLVGPELGGRNRVEGRSSPCPDSSGMIPAEAAGQSPTAMCGLGLSMHIFSLLMIMNSQEDLMSSSIQHRRLIGFRMRWEKG